MANRGCGTCRARKVLCDRTQPKCHRCTQSGKQCAGYGMRLSWPRDGDRKRTIKGPQPPKENAAPKAGNSHLVNVFPWDVEMQYYVSHPQAEYDDSLALLADRVHARTVAGSQGRMRSYLPQPAALPISYAHTNLTRHENELLQYFVSVASFTLKTFSQNVIEIRDVVLRMALSDGSLISKAVLRSAITLASIHRDGPQSDAVKFKVSALRALSEASSNDDMNQPETFQHVAAGMLLCSYEVQATSTTGNDWLWYVCGSKHIISGSDLDDATSESDFASLIGWVQYYDTLARFSLRHWRRQRDGSYIQIEGLKISVDTPTVCNNNTGGVMKSYSNEILSLLSEVCDNVLDPSHPDYHTDDYRNYIKVLEWKLRNAQIPEQTPATNMNSTTTETSRILELFRLATLIYLVRSSKDFIKASTKLHQWTKSAFEIVPLLGICISPFPLLILGCEAESDERRVSLLDIIARTETKTQTRDLEFVTDIIQAIWAQQDLAEEELDYAHKLRVIFSSSGIVPALV